jgi:hypothetical protein
MTTHTTAVEAGTDRRPLLAPALRRWRAEWERWRSGPAAQRGLLGWQSRHPVLAGFGTLDELVDGCGRSLAVPQDVADVRLAVLVGEARAGDQAAARVVLERVMPGLVRAAAARAAGDEQLTFTQALDDVIAAAWVRIATYPLERRPAKIAANIVADSRHRCFGYVGLTARRTAPAPPDRLPATSAALTGDPSEAGHPGVRLLRLLTDAVAGGLPVADARLLADLAVCGSTPEQLALRDGVTARTIRYRRRAAMRRLLDHVGRCLAVPDDWAGPDPTRRYRTVRPPRPAARDDRP